jgi:cytochrome b
MPASAIRVWDPLVRIVHWSVACLVLIELFNEAGANPWHRYFGYIAGALVVLRLAWGICRTPHASLASLARSASRVVPYLALLRSRAERPIVAGHNPLGAFMALTLWALILFVVVTGWMLRLDAYWGDETVETLHSAGAYVLGGCAAVHVPGVLVTSVLYRTNLVKAMITGTKVFRNRDTVAVRSKGP